MGNEFIECLREAFLLQMVDNPTRIRLGQTGNILDLVLVNEEQLMSEIEHYSPIGKSDHETVFFNLYIRVDRWNANDEGYTLDLKNGNYAKMRQMLKQTDWSQMLDSSVEQCWNLIKNKIHESMRECIPTKNINKPQRTTPRWMNRIIKRNVKKKYNLYNKYLNTLSDDDGRNYIHVEDGHEAEVARGGDRCFVVRRQ